MNSVKPLTAKQKLVFDFITNYHNEYGVSPTLREIACFLGTDNISTAQYFVEQIKTKGHISKTANSSRGISTSESGVRVTIPLLGRIAAGEPIEAIEESRTIDVPSHFKLNSSSSYYALTVSGDSMMGLGILDGDIVFIRTQFTANDGDVVVAVIDGNATLKVFKRGDDTIILEPRNSNYKPIKSKHVEIRGKFVGLMRGGAGY